MSKRDPLWWVFMSIAWACYALATFHLVVQDDFSKATYGMALATFWLVMAGPYRDQGRRTGKEGG